MTRRQHQNDKYILNIIFTDIPRKKPNIEILLNCEITAILYFTQY